MSDYDSPWKEALDRYFRPFLELLFPEVHAGVDWSRGYELLDAELRQVVREAEAGRRIVDKLVRVWRTDGREEWVLVHVEVQSQEVADFGRRMYVCNYRILDRYDRMVASLAVLGDDRPGWRPDRFGYTLWGCSVGFRFPTVKLLDFAAREQELEQSDNLFATVVLAHLKARETTRDPERRRYWKVRLIRNLYDRGLAREDVRELFRIIHWLMDLPREVERQIWQDVQAIEQEKQMPYMTTLEQMWLEEGIEKGMEKGMEQAVEWNLVAKFGEEGRSLIADVRRAPSLDLFRALLERIPTATSLDEVRTILSSRDSSK